MNKKVIIITSIVFVITLAIVIFILYKTSISGALNEKGFSKKDIIFEEKYYSSHIYSEWFESLLLVYNNNKTSLAILLKKEIGWSLVFGEETVEKYGRASVQLGESSIYYAAYVDDSYEIPTIQNIGSECYAEILQVDGKKLLFVRMYATFANPDAIGELESFFNLPR